MNVLSTRISATRWLDFVTPSVWAAQETHVVHDSSDAETRVRVTLIGRTGCVTGVRVSYPATLQSEKNASYQAVIEPPYRLPTDHSEASDSLVVLARYFGSKVLSELKTHPGLVRYDVAEKIADSSLPYPDYVVDPLVSKK